MSFISCKEFSDPSVHILSIGWLLTCVNLHAPVCPASLAWSIDWTLTTAWLIWQFCQLKKFVAAATVALRWSLQKKLLVRIKKDWSQGIWCNTLALGNLNVFKWSRIHLTEKAELSACCASRSWCRLMPVKFLFTLWMHHDLNHSRVLTSKFN